MKKNLLYSLYALLFLVVSFLSYCFFPLLSYNASKEPARIFIKDRNWIIITDKANEYGYKKSIKIDFKSRFVSDLIKIEDKNYYHHFWIDLFSKLWAIKSNVLYGKVVAGWSTITEQYIKNKYFKDSKRTYLQKSREAFLSVYFSLFQRESPKYEGEGLESKEIILSNYLNNVYLWNNLYWVWSAMKVYFWKADLNDLSEEEITLLISLIHNPGIETLEDKDFRQYLTKTQNKLWYTFDRTIYKLNKKVNIDKFPIVTKKVIEELTHPWIPSLILGKEATSLQNNNSINNIVEDLKVSIDAKLQEYAQETLNKTLASLKWKNVTNWAIFAINPKTKQVLIYQASRDFYSKEIDWQVDVIQSLRQPGSTMKPFLYLMALQNGANPDDLLLDLNNKLNSFQEWKTYISNNYSLNEYWLIRLKKALWNSLNNASVRLASELWLNKVFDFYKEYWFQLPESADYYWYSLVLWNPSIKLSDLVRSYSKLIPNPNWPPPNPLLGKAGEQEQVEQDDLETEQAKFLLYDILSDSDNRDLSFWVNSIMNTSIAQAVKTGTSSDFRDNVIVSYHPDFVIGIWVGNNDNSSMIGVTWITGAWYIWHNTIEKAIELWYIKNRKIELPKWIEQSEYCLDEQCFRKKLVYKKTWKKYYSRILDARFSSKDLYEKLNSDEVDRLKDFQMYLEE